MRTTSRLGIGVGMLVLSCGGDGHDVLELQQAEAALTNVGATPAVLCFTQGDAAFASGPPSDINGELSFEGSAQQTRALLDDTFGAAGAYQRVKLTFDYDQAVGSNTWRRQVALKLKAANSCNVIYVTWVFEKNGGSANSLEVKQKQSPAQWLDSQCGTDGYTTLSDTPMPESIDAPEVGDRLTLEAELDGNNTLKVWVSDRDGEETLVYDQTHSTLSSHAGWAGVRTDNVDGVVEVEGSTNTNAFPTYVATRGYNGSGSSNANGLPFSNSCYYLDASGTQRVGSAVPPAP